MKKNESSNSKDIAKKVTSIALSYFKHFLVNELKKKIFKFNPFTFRRTTVRMSTLVDEDDFDRECQENGFDPRPKSHRPYTDETDAEDVSGDFPIFRLLLLLFPLNDIQNSHIQNL